MLNTFSRAASRRYQYCFRAVETFLLTLARASYSQPGRFQRAART